MFLSLLPCTKKRARIRQLNQRNVYEEAAAASWGEVLLQENWRKLTQDEKKAGGTKQIAVQDTARLTPPLMDGSVPGCDVKNYHMKDMLLGGAAAAEAAPTPRRYRIIHSWHCGPTVTC